MTEALVPPLQWAGDLSLESLCRHALAIGAAGLRLQHTGSGMRIAARIDGHEYAIARIDRAGAQELLDALALGEPALPAHRADEAPSRSFAARRLAPRDGSHDWLLRRLEPHPPDQGLDALGLEDQDLDLLRRALSAPSGFVLVAGPADSGCTTTLYAMASESAALGRSVHTLESPVAWHVCGWCQWPIAEAAGCRVWADQLSAVARADPGLVILGRLAGRRLLRQALRTVDRGAVLLAPVPVGRAHLVFGALQEQGIAPRALAPRINLILGLRLVRRLCRHCALADGTRAVREVLAQALNSWLSADGIHALQARAGGCSYCLGTGYRGRTPVYECLPLDVPARVMAEADNIGTEMEQVLLAPGRSLWDRGLRLLAGGVTSLAALRAAVPEPR